MGWEWGGLYLDPDQVCFQVYLIGEFHLKRVLHGDLWELSNSAPRQKINGLWTSREKPSNQKPLVCGSAAYRWQCNRLCLCRGLRDFTVNGSELAMWMKERASEYVLQTADWKMGLNEPLKELPVFWKDPQEAGNSGLSGEGISLLCLMRGRSSVAVKSVTLETLACPLVVVWFLTLKGLSCKMGL